MKKHYIKAVLEMLQSGNDISVVLEGLSRILEQKGHESLQGSILRGVLTQLSAKGLLATATVTVAKTDTLEKHKASIKAALVKVNAPDSFETTVDELIIGGHVVSYNNVVLDESYKSVLTNLYRSITK